MLPEGEAGSSRWRIATEASFDGSVIIGDTQFANGNKVFVWTEATGMRSLQQLLVDEGVTEAEGWVGFRAIPSTASEARIGQLLGQSVASWIQKIPDKEVIVSLGVVSAIRVGKRLVWDGPNMKAMNCPEADPFLRPEYRKGWTL